MNAKTYRVRSMQEAMRLIREELGPEASVLHTRQIGQAWWRRLAGGPRIEVVAANDVEAPSRLSIAKRAAPEPALAAAPLPRNEPQETVIPRRAIAATVDATPSPIESPATPPTKRTGNANAPSKGRGVLRRLQEQMRAAELPPEAVREYVAQLKIELPRIGGDSKALRRRLLGLLEAEFKASGPVRVAPGRRRVIALVGPTGVGKTTTIAKLAANYHLRQRSRVGLITVDTFRIAAADQLRTYADIIGVPLEVVATPAEMSRALARLADRDLVFLDTSGHGPRDAVRIGELKTMLSHARPDETHLVLSASASGTSQNRAAEMFAAARPTALILTKLDEALALGALWPLLRTHRWPVSYFTGGQNVPDDIEPATTSTLARRLIGLSTGDSHG